MMPMYLLRNGFLLLLSLTIWSSSPPESPRPVTHTVEIRNMKFVPAQLEVEKGDAVVFVNKDMVIHNVTEEKNTWASPTIPPKKSWTYTVKNSFSYYCSYHPMMKGKVKIKE